MGRIYGLSEDKYKELEPYIQISESFLPKKKEKTLVKEYKKTEKKDTMVSVRRIVKYPEGTLVDINRADTIELQKIPGIGSGISKLIVAYRNRLGGFYALEQLLEVKFVTSDMLKWFKLEDEIQRKIDINKVGLEELRAHPYLNFYQAKVIVEHRRKKGPIKSLSQLALYEEFTEKDLERLSAYISFD
jgi:competence ComEA-like helix-hairpin-helix protein